MELVEVRDLQQACDYVLEHDTVHNDGISVPMSSMSLWVEAIERMKRFDQNTGGTDGTPAELIDLARQDLRIGVCVVAFGRMLDELDLLDEPLD